MTDSAQTAVGQPAPVRFSRLSRRGVILGLTAAQLVTIGVGAIPVLAALYRGGGLEFALPVAALTATIAVVPVGGRHLIDWLPVLVSWTWRTLTGQLEFRARTTRPRPAGTLALPGDAAALRQYVDPVTGAVMVHDPHAATLTTMLEVTHPAFALQDPADQQRRVAGWGRVLATVCRSGHLARMQVVERTLPGSGSSLADWWHTHGSDDGSWAATAYQDLIERAGPAGEQHATTLALTLDMRAAARAVRAAGGGVTGAAAVLRAETDTLATALHAADLTPSAPLGPDELAITLRTAYDPSMTPALDRHPDVGRDLATAGPIAVAESWGMLRSDGAWHCVLWIAQWPQAGVHPGFLAPLLLASGVCRTVSLSYEPVRADVAARDLRRRRTGHLADRAQRARLGQLTDAADAAELDDVLTQEADLAAGHGLLRVTGLISVSAHDPDELERSVAAVEQAAIQASCDVRRLWGQQAQAFTAALPLGRPR